MFNVLLIAAAVSGWCCSLILVHTLLTKKKEPEVRVIDVEDTLIQTNKQLEQNIEHLERITEMLEEENKNWEDLVKDYLERSEQK